MPQRKERVSLILNQLHNHSVKIYFVLLSTQKTVKKHPHTMQLVDNDDYSSDEIASSHY